MLGSPLDFVDEVDPTTAPRSTATGPEAGLGELIGARFREARNGPGWNTQDWQMENGRVQISEALRKRGYDIPDYEVTQARDQERREARGEKYFFIGQTHAEKDRILWGALAKERERDPAFLPELNGVRDLPSLENWVIARRRAEVAKAEDVISRGRGVNRTLSYVGAFGAGALDVSSYIPVGGGAMTSLSVARQILTVGAREAGANMAITLATEPLVRADAQRMGVQRDAGDLGTDLLVAGALGFGIGATGKSLELGVEHAPELIFPHLPAAMREKAYARALAAGTLDDRVTVRAWREATAPTQTEMRLTPDEHVALAVMERHADVRESSPFMPTAEGDRAHGQRLATALEQILAGQPVQLPRVRGSGFRADLLSSAAPVEPLASADTALADKIIGRESGGNPNARNTTPGQTASGLGQFTDRTWLNLYRRFVGGAGMSDAEILGLKTDPVLGRRMTQIAVGQHKAWLRSSGLPVTDGNVYLMHFLGTKAIDVLRAAPETPIAALLPESWIRANERILRGKTAGDVIAWTDKRMGGTGLTPRFEGDAAILRPDLFETPEEHATAQHEIAREGQGPRETGVDPGEHPIIEATPEAAPSPAPVVTPSREDALAHVPTVLDYINQSRGSLQIERMAAALDLDTETVRRAAAIIAARPDAPIIVSKPKARLIRDEAGNVLGSSNAGGRIMRKPTLRGPLDLLTQIAAWGGVRDSQGHALRRDLGLKRRMTKAGPVVNQGGLTIEALGERLHEAGWFAQADRPTEADVLDMLDRAARSKEKLFHPGEQAEPTAPTPDQADREHVIWQAGQDLGIALDQDLMDAALGYLDEGLEPGEATLAAMREIFDDAQAADLQSLDQPSYDVDSLVLASEAEARGWNDPLEGQRAAAGDAQGYDPSGGAQDEGSALRPGETGLVGENARQPDGGPEVERRQALADAERAKAFDDPDAGDGVKAQIDSIEHDLRMSLGAAVDPAIAERQRQQAALGAAAPMRKPVEQDGTMGLGLFDAADQPEFRLEDGGGDRGLDDILRALDDEEKAIDRIEGCMKPGGGGGAE